MKLGSVFFVALIVLLASCSSAPEQVVCNKPYIQVGSQCCLDQNDNSICDSDETVIDAQPEEENTEEVAENPVEEIKLTAQDKLEATNFAQRLSRNWEKNEWSEIYAVILDEEKEVVSEKEFVFFMDIVSVYSKAKYDQDFQDKLYGGYYTGFKRGQGFEMTVGELEFSDDEPEATVNMHSMKFDDVLLNVPLFPDEDPDFVVSYGFQPFNLYLTQDGWKVRTLGVYFMGNEHDIVCESTNYPYECNFEYAKTFNNFEVCDETGYLISDCYEHFSKPLELEKAVSGCKNLREKPDQDECLLNLMVLQGDEMICERMNLGQNSYICYGMLAGHNENLDECFDRVQRGNMNVENNQEAQCIYGYVWVTKDKSKCKGIDEKASGDFLEDCSNLRYP